tara:strand:+ start:144 stop:1106 length:963 start_codon:yes stop_codon:yes gene_type:complete
MPFRFAASKVHLTYKTHLDLEPYKATVLAKLPKIKMLSFVHDEGDADEEDPTPYAHTHVFIWTHENMDTTDPRFFDFQDIHPNLQNRRSIRWAQTIVMAYHLGHKTNEEGGKTYKAPIFLHQEGVAEWDIVKDTWKLCNDAPTVEEACLELGIVPKTIAEVKKVKALDRKRKAETIDDDADPSKFKVIDWDRKKALVLRGPSATCKTNWAIHQFKVPMKIKDLDELKDMPDGCDGIIFDECLFDKCSKKTMVSLLDTKQDRTIRTRKGIAHIPRGMSKIFICNEHEHPFGHDRATGGHESVTGRYNELNVFPGFLLCVKE